MKNKDYYEHETLKSLVGKEEEFSCRDCDDNCCSICDIGKQNRLEREIEQAEREYEDR
jgi:hypothetical protein